MGTFKPIFNAAKLRIQDSAGKPLSIFHPANAPEINNGTAPASMYRNFQARLNETISGICDSLTGMALDPRLMPGVAAEMRTIRSSASTPSLRSREGSVGLSGRMDTPGGNVRVVVRVRGFLPRGMNACIMLKNTTDCFP